MSEFTREEFQRMYDEVTDPEIIERNRRKREREERINDKMKDTGI